MTEHTLDSNCQTLGEFLGTLDCTLVRLVEEILGASGQATDDAVRIAKDIETEYKNIHLLQSLTVERYITKKNIHLLQSLTVERYITKTPDTTNTANMTESRSAIISRTDCVVKYTTQAQKLIILNAAKLKS